MPQTVLHNIEELPQILSEMSQRQLFLVTDPLAYEQSGAQDKLSPLLSDFSVSTFSEFEPNPKIEDVLTGVRLLSRTPEAIVVAIGGGTAIDIAKLICCFAAQESEVSSERLPEFCANSLEILPRQHQLITIPTTAGTGSEATQFAVVYLNQVKYSVSHASLVPDVAVLDAELTHSLPARITTATGLDALSQAIESMWSVRSTDESIGWAEEALLLGLPHLEQAVLEPTPESRRGLLQAAHLAGKAINVSRTTAPHALSYTMTIRHQVPHGMAVALSIAPFLRFNAEADANDLLDPRGLTHHHEVFRRIVSAFGFDPDDEDAVEQTARHWEQLLVRIDCPARLSDWGIEEEAEIEQIARSVNQQRLANNPREVTESDLRGLLQEIA